MSEEVPGGPGVSGEANFPRARSAGLITTESDGELVIYDEVAKHIHHLNAVSAVVWRLCDGQRGVGEIATAATGELGVTVDPDAVTLALAKLGDANLLTQGAIVPRESRRRFARKVALFGAAAVPAVVSITAPLASAAASGCTGATLDNCGNNRSRIGRCCWYIDIVFKTGVCNQSLECVPLS